MPRLTGQVRRCREAADPKDLRWALPHVVVGTLFIGMVLALVVCMLYWPADLSRFYQLSTVTLVAALIASLWMRLQGTWRPPLTAFDALLFLATVSGLPGILLSPSSAQTTGLTFFVALATRNYICFVALPRATLVRRPGFQNAVVGWLLAASALVIVGSLQTASALGVSLQSSTRLTGEGNNWLNANTTGVYTACGILMAAMGRFVPRWIRAAVICAGSYVLLLTQSRTSMAALLLALLANWIVLHYHRRWRAAAAGIIGCAILYLAAPFLLDTLTGFRQMGVLIERTEQWRDPWSGRMALIDAAVLRIEGAPVFGYGYMAEEGRFENGYLSLTLESGLVGLAAYLALIILVLSRAFRLLRQRQRPELQDLARYAICLTAFILAHGMGERTHAFQTIFAGSNAWAILAGMVFAYTSAAWRLPHSRAACAPGIGASAGPMNIPRTGPAGRAHEPQAVACLGVAHD